MSTSVIKSTLVKVRQISNLTGTEVLEIVKDFQLNETQALVLIFEEFGDMCDIELIYREALPMSLKDALSNYSKVIAVAITISLFRDCIKYYKLEQQYKSFIERPKCLNVTEYLPPMQLMIGEIPTNFIKDNKHLKQEVDIINSYVAYYLKYRFIFSLWEFKAIFFSEDIILSRLGSYEEAGKYLFNQSTVKMQELRDHMYTESQQVAIMLLKSEGKVNTDLLHCVIPGECKDRLLYSKSNISTKLSNYARLYYTKVTVGI